MLVIAFNYRLPSFNHKIALGTGSGMRSVAFYRAKGRPLISVNGPGQSAMRV